ncbi:hypothetical protein JOB18_013678 [Solea senegalensis]|uniref:Uncharacterized protein n=1 Tax=Solea senegalensis TaxID=28829 RepID=A0AAV6T532_SOLSE|nr:hypothetical protein JOB18_013678 [Solea senegalensis]
MAVNKLRHATESPPLPTHLSQCDSCVMIWGVWTAVCLASPRRRIWRSFVEELPGGASWRSFLEELPGGASWRSVLVASFELLPSGDLEELPGGASWRSFLEELPGGAS